MMALVVDKDLTRILRANFHLNPDALPTAETGTRHRITAARMSLLTKLHRLQCLLAVR